MDGTNPGHKADVLARATQSLPVRRLQQPEGRMGTTKVTHAEVSKSLLFGQLPPKTPPGSLFDRDSVYAIDPETSLEDELRMVEEPQLDDESFSFKESDLAQSRDISNTPLETDDSNTSEDMDSDLVTQSLTTSSLRKMLENTDPEASLVFDSTETDTDTNVSGPVMNLDEDESGDENDEDDELFMSVSSVPFEDRVAEAQDLLEQSVFTSMIPSKPMLAEASLSTQVTRAWSQFHQTLQQPDDSPAMERQLLEVLHLYPAITDSEKVADFLLRQTKGTSPEDAVQTCQNFLEKFQIAGTSSPDELSTLDTLSDHEAAQVLLIMRQKTLSEGGNTEVIDRALQQRLLQAHGRKMEQELGLDFDEAQPDYEHFSRLSNTLGQVQLGRNAEAGASNIPKPEDGWDIKIDEKKYVPEHIPISDAPAQDKTLEHVIGQKALGLAEKNPNGELSALIKLDAWLTSDETRENTVTEMMSRAYAQPVREKGEALGLYEEVLDSEDESDADKTPTSSLNQTEGPLSLESGTKAKKKRVRFRDQPDVIPSGRIRGGDDFKADIKDLVPLDGRDKASHLTREYTGRLTSLLQSMESQIGQAMQDATDQGLEHLPQADEEVHTRLFKYRNLAEKCRTSPSKNHVQRYQLLEMIDNEFDAADNKPAGSRANAREEWVRNHASVKAKLVDGSDLLSLYESHLAQMVVKTVDVAFSKAVRGQQLYKLDESLEPVRRKRGTPATSAIMSSIDPVTRVYDQAMELDISTPAECCKSLMQVQDPRVMLALRIRLDKEGKSALYIPNWEKRMKEVMCRVQAEQITQTIDFRVRNDAAETYGVDNKGFPKAPDEYMEGRTEAYVKRMVKEVLNGKMRRPGITDTNNSKYQRTWDTVLKSQNYPTDVNQVLKLYMPAPEELLDELAGMGVVSKISTPAPGPAASTSTGTQGQEEGMVTWVVNKVSSWFGWK